MAQWLSECPKVCDRKFENIISLSANMFLEKIMMRDSMIDGN
jgi:hypothetical protein